MFHYSKYLFNRAIRKSKQFRIFPVNYGKSDSERCIEIDFARFYYKGENTVLDIGYAFSEPRWFEMIQSLHIPNLIGLDPAANIKPSGYKKVVKGDIRKTKFSENTFDLAICISTLEHIGMDNKIYGYGKNDNDFGSQLEAMKEIYRILKPGGKLLLTLPFGKFINYGWFIQYDLSSLGHLIINSNFKSKSIETYYFKKGWQFCKLRDCNSIKYQTAKHMAGAIVCLVLEK